MSKFSACVARASAALLVLTVAGSAWAGAITIPVKTTVGGTPNTTIGSISASMSGPGPFSETGAFTFAGTFGSLDSCYDFRWYQIITSAPAATLALDGFKYKDATGAFTLAPTTPFVDPPSGGYKYQQPAGDDNKPFYESDTEFVTTHVEGTSSSTSDEPTPQDIYFETYLVVIGGDIPANTFRVLAGYSWNTNLTAGVLTNPDPVALAVPLAVGNLATLQTALNQSGFVAAGYNNAWTVTNNANLTPCVPEPASFVFTGLGCAALLGVARRRRAA